MFVRLIITAQCSLTHQHTHSLINSCRLLLNCFFVVPSTITSFQSSHTRIFLSIVVVLLPQLIHQLAYKHQLMRLSAFFHITLNTLLSIFLHIPSHSSRPSLTSTGNLPSYHLSLLSTFLLITIITMISHSCRPASLSFHHLLILHSY